MVKKGPLERHTDADDLRYLEETWVRLDRGRNVRSWEYGVWHGLPQTKVIDTRGWPWSLAVIVLIAFILIIMWIQGMAWWFLSLFEDTIVLLVLLIVVVVIVAFGLVMYMRRGPRSAGPKEGGYFRLLKLSMQLLTRAAEDGLNEKGIRYRMGVVHELDDVAMRLFRFEVEDVKLALFVHEPSMTSVVFVTPDSPMHGPMVDHIKDSMEATVPLL